MRGFELVLFGFFNRWIAILLVLIATRAHLLSYAKVWLAAEGSCGAEKREKIDVMEISISYQEVKSSLNSLYRSRD